ncbi:T6SS immunity protein Tli4 family protein [Frateuria sp. Soil773]|uniref:T6SS immunity protein Tli4 family protein n=1 Tax=Frateuria sp. Soil773 TaxID=1736407 RepID=UPI0012F80FE3|nr:T6SS immunity protein Tli4 family protein [Frateuria sp. Soil773]
MSELTQTMRTQCLGRYQFDLPSSFSLNSSPADAKPAATLYFGRDKDFKTVDFGVLAEGVTPQQFAAAILKRRDQIASKSNDEAHASMLVAFEKLNDREIMLESYLGTEVDGGARAHELHLLVEDNHVVLKTESFKGADKPAEECLARLATQVRKVADPAQAGPGFCLGQVIIDADNDFEDASVSFSSNDRKHREMVLDASVNGFKRDAADPGLVERTLGSLSAAGNTKPQVICKGDLQLAGQPGQQLVMGSDLGGLHGQMMVAESYPPSPSLATSSLFLQLNGGRLEGDDEDVTSSLTDNEAVALWDAILKSARPRPNAVKASR